MGRFKFRQRIPGRYCTSVGEVLVLANKRRIRPESLMSAFQSLAPRPPAGLETLHNIVGSLVARYRQEEVLTAVRQIPARVAKFRPIPAWVTSSLSDAYRAKGNRELYTDHE